MITKATQQISYPTKCQRSNAASVLESMTHPWSASLSRSLMSSRVFRKYLGVSPSDYRNPLQLPLGGKMTAFGLLIFDDAEELDFCGPWEIFTASSMLRDFSDEVVLISEHSGPVRCSKGMSPTRPCLARGPATGCASGPRRLRPPARSLQC